MDKIIIRDLEVETIIGTLPRERKIRQKLIINLEIVCEIRKAGKSDKLSDTLNYKTLKNQILTHVGDSSRKLIESVAEDVANICLQDPRVQSVKVTVDKPGALTGARSVAVEIQAGRQ